MMERDLVLKEYFSLTQADFQLAIEKYSQVSFFENSKLIQLIKQSNRSFTKNAQNHKQSSVSIILPTYNREDFILTAINSVVAQTYNDWELIIIDDGSTDSTKDFIAPYTKDLRIRYYFQKNQERSAARNNGIDLAKGKFICFLDSDDYYLSNHLSILNDEIEKLHNPNIILQ